MQLVDVFVSFLDGLRLPAIDAEAQGFVEAAGRLIAGKYGQRERLKPNLPGFFDEM
jgi:hypothetical protein